MNRAEQVAGPLKPLTIALFVAAGFGLAESLTYAIATSGDRPSAMVFELLPTIAGVVSLGVAVFGLATFTRLRKLRENVVRNAMLVGTIAWLVLALKGPAWRAVSVFAGDRAWWLGYRWTTNVAEITLIGALLWLVHRIAKTRLGRGVPIAAVAVVGAHVAWRLYYLVASPKLELSLPIRLLVMLAFSMGDFAVAAACWWLRGKLLAPVDQAASPASYRTEDVEATTGSEPRPRGSWYEAGLHLTAYANTVAAQIFLLCAVVVLGGIGAFARSPGFLKLVSLVMALGGLAITVRFVIVSRAYVRELPTNAEGQTGAAAVSWGSVLAAVFTVLGLAVAIALAVKGQSRALKKLPGALSLQSGGVGLICLFAMLSSAKAIARQLKADEVVNRLKAVMLGFIIHLVSVTGITIGLVAGVRRFRRSYFMPTLILYFAIFGVGVVLALKFVKALRELAHRQTEYVEEQS